MIARGKSCRVSAPFCGPAFVGTWILPWVVLVAGVRVSSGGDYVVLGYSEAGMHCMNRDFSQLTILPPFNNLRAQVIDRRRNEPKILDEGVSVRYAIPSNTVSATKTNFWLFAPALFGVQLPPNIGLTGNGLRGWMQPTELNDWVVTGIPITPINDMMLLDPYPLAKIDVIANRRVVATTQTVVPVSWEINCGLCHGGTGGNVDRNILATHDRLHGTRLQNSTPVLCGRCHAQAPLGTAGVTGVPSLSHAMHGSHASRMGAVAGLGNTCYACHPGVQTNCQRDVHFAKGIMCVNCHGTMADVASTTRRPWVDEPTCKSCHQKRRPDFRFEESGKLFKESRGHHEVMCAACHGAPHAITPTVTAVDNLQAMALQGFAGPIHKCTVCHRVQPEGRFEHHK